ncbi:phytase [Erythrobacter sp. YT30]|uniref:phytase n=1 Tax=Erythrobacter sp. YT30 TaxID=1735012 RepID=UPI00076D72B9|nr:phytase [Erythrobacter sp. YT30]KWV92147.1 3-phytase [Erythrobacter sp. YT30]
MSKAFHGFALITLGIAAACATIPRGDPAVSVMASAETVPVGTTNEDAADDPAIWRNPEDPAKSLIVGTDKKAGLHIYNLQGEQLSFLEAPGLNNVDLVEIAGFVVIVASDRSDLETAHLSVSIIDPRNPEFGGARRIPVGPGEGYGICLSEPAADRSFYAFSAPKSGVIYRTLISEGPSGDLAHETTTLASVPSQPEGCVVDDRTNTLYLGEEAAGVWAIDIETGEKELVAPTGTGMTVPDVEGLALAPEGADGGYLVASSQGDNAFAVYRLPTMEPLGRFRIVEGAFGSVEETDGIELDPRSFGPEFPRGLFVAQDGVNPPDAQNFKLVRWDEILAQIEDRARP